MDKRYFLIKLAGKDDQEKGLPWAVYEYTDETYQIKKLEAPFILKGIFLQASAFTHKLGGAHFIAAPGQLKIEEGWAWIT